MTQVRLQRETGQCCHCLLRKTPCVDDVRKKTHDVRHEKICGECCDYCDCSSSFSQNVRNVNGIRRPPYPSIGADQRNGYGDDCDDEKNDPTQIPWQRGIKSVRSDVDENRINNWSVRSDCPPPSVPLDQIRIYFGQYNGRCFGLIRTSDSLLK